VGDCTASDVVDCVEALRCGETDMPRTLEYFLKTGQTVLGNHSKLQGAHTGKDDTIYKKY
jgi:hypothetical protein